MSAKKHVANKFSSAKKICKHNADKQGKQGQRSNSPAVSNIHCVDSDDDGAVIVYRWGWDGVQS